MVSCITEPYDDMEISTTCRKQKERSRSRHNREQFRSLIGELSLTVTGRKLSTNKCLMAVSKTFKLSKISDFDKCGEDPAKKKWLAPLPSLLAMEGHLGWAFDSEGYILYVSPNFQKRLNIPGCVIGTHLSKLMPEYDFVLRNLFIENRRSTCTTIKKKSSKLAFRPSPTPAYMYGKVLSTHQGDKIYVGSVIFYVDKSSYHHQNFRHSNANFSEIVLDKNFEFSKRHKLLDKMQGFVPPMNNFLDIICPQDVPRVISQFKSLGSRKQFNLAFRVKKSRSLENIMVYGQFYMGNTQNGSSVISAFISPAVLDKLDEDELFLQGGEVHIKQEEVLDMETECPHTPCESGTSNAKLPVQPPITGHYDDDLYGFDNPAQNNDRDILNALDEMFPSDDGSEDDFQDMPQLELPDFITCFNDFQ